jgi:hypothetical protein
MKKGHIQIQDRGQDVYFLVVTDGKHEILLGKIVAPPGPDLPYFTVPPTRPYTDFRSAAKGLFTYLIHRVETA